MDQNGTEGEKESEAEEETNERLGLEEEEEEEENEFSNGEFEFEEQDLSNDENYIYSFKEEEEAEDLGEFADELTSNEETENEEGSAHMDIVSKSMLGLAVVSEDICPTMEQPDLPDIVSSATILHEQGALQLTDDQITCETTAYPQPDLSDSPIISRDNVQGEDLLSLQRDTPSRFAEADRQHDSKGRLDLVDAGKILYVSVKIEQLPCKKPYLGGFRNKATGQEYHNASSQTQVDMWNVESEVERRSGFQLSHHTQTEEQKHLLMQTRNDKSTQMTGIGVYIPNITDRLIQPNKYITADEYQSRLLQQVITIQKYYRHWLANVNVEALLTRKRCLDELRNQKEQDTDLERRKQLQLKYERRLHPRTNQDFDLLFTYLEKWRKKEMDGIDKMLSGASRKAALCDLMDRQAQLIHCIVLRRLEIADDLHLQFVESFLNKVYNYLKTVAPETLNTRRNQVVMVNDSTLQAKELKDVFQMLNIKYLAADERLDLLVTVRSILQLHPCSVSAELEKLIDRENELLVRGFSDRSMEGLHKRIANLFLQYIKLPMVNPAAAGLSKVPSDPLTLKGNMHLCPGCHCYLSPNDFHHASNQRKLGWCRACNRINNHARKRKDFSIFLYMLKNLCRSEDLYNDNAKTAYLMQEKDLRYLIVYIWHSKSILSAHDDLHDLEIVRWNQCEEWSPWNCILLTKKEAQEHYKFRNLEEAYAKNFIHDVHCKHLMAKKYFYRMLTMVNLMPSTSDDATTVVRNLTKMYLSNKCV